MIAATARRCIFCGGAGPMTREHVLADWIGREFGIKGPQGHWHLAETDAGSRVRQYLPRPFRSTAKCVCASCNAGWMARLEGAVRPILRPMMLSRISFRLSREDQELLPYWAMKTVMAMQCVMPTIERIVPVEHYEELMREERPPDRVRIAIARRAFEPEAWPYRFLQVGAKWRVTPPPARRPNREEYNTYRAILAIGHAVFHILGFHDELREGNLRPGDLPAGFVEIWPVEARLLWPPEPEVAMRDLERLTQLGSATLVRRRRGS